jgi:hypothetical protein
LTVAASKEGVGVAFAVGVGDDGMPGAGVVWASSIGQARATHVAVRRRDSLGKFRVEAAGIVITRRIPVETHKNLPPNMCAIWLSFLSFQNIFLRT